MKTATITKKESDHVRGTRTQVTATVDPPIDGHSTVLVSGVLGGYDMFGASLHETYIFPVNESGEVTCWGELSGSRRGISDPEALLKELGYTINDATE